MSTSTWKATTPRYVRAIQCGLPSGLLSPSFVREQAKASMIQQLHRLLRPFMLRRLKADVATSIPPKKETILEIGMTACQKKLYKSVLSRDLDAVLGSSGGDRLRLQNIMMQLRKVRPCVFCGLPVPASLHVTRLISRLFQVCAHPYLFEGIEDRSLDPMGDHVINNCAKLRLLDKLLPKLKARGSRVLIFSQMTRLLDILEDYLRIRSFDYCRIDGAATSSARQLCNESRLTPRCVPASCACVYLCVRACVCARACSYRPVHRAAGSSSYEVREDSIDAFNKEGSSKFAFLLSTRAGGLGINLATADTVILYDSDWNPQVDLQVRCGAAAACDHRGRHSTQLRLARPFSDVRLTVLCSASCRRKTGPTASAKRSR